MSPCLVFLQILLQFIVSLCSEPNPPSWPSSVHIFKPGNDSYIQSVVDEVFKVNGGSDPECNGQWSDERHALLFLPGTHKVTVNVGYYTTVMGLGENPQDTIIENVVASNGGNRPSPGALNNFWRNAENFKTTPTSNTMMWAVSQGVSLRRVIVDGDLALFDADGYASGGYLSNSHITGAINSGGQQQWYTRNTYLKSWIGGVWNMVYQGLSTMPNSFCANQTSLHTSLENTPIIAEKPFISYDDGKYYLMVPPVEYNKVGPTDFYNLPTSHISKIDFANVYVTDPITDTAASINSKISKGLHIVLTAGNYNISEPIKVTTSNTVVLGIGFPTLMSSNGNILMDIADGVYGVRISGVLYEAGHIKASTLIRVGTSSKANSVDYNFFYDVFARVGGPNKKQVMADIMMQINSNNVIVDNSWLWRADHDINGVVTDCANPVNTALQVNGDNVHTYCLKVEHTLGNMVEWNGNNGSIYFFQSEFPYDVNQEQYGDPGYNAVRVSDSVKRFKGYGMGMYSYFRDYDVTVQNAIQVPQNADEIQFTNLCTVWLDGRGQISHVINGLGGAVTIEYRDTPSSVCTFRSKTVETNSSTAEPTSVYTSQTTKETVSTSAANQGSNGKYHTKDLVIGVTLGFVFGVLLTLLFMGIYTVYKRRHQELRKDSLSAGLLGLDDSNAGQTSVDQRL